MWALASRILEHRILVFDDRGQGRRWLCETLSISYRECENLSVCSGCHSLGVQQLIVIMLKGFYVQGRNVVKPLAFWEYLLFGDCGGLG